MIIHSNKPVHTTMGTPPLRKEGRKDDYSHSSRCLGWAANGLQVAHVGGNQESQQCLSIYLANRKPFIFVSRLPFLLLFYYALLISISQVNSTCIPAHGCPALAYYTVPPLFNVTFISTRFFGAVAVTSIEKFNTDIPDIGSVVPGQSIRIPFNCGCVDEIMTLHFPYQVQADDTLTIIAEDHYHYQHLTKVEWIVEATPLSDKDTIIDEEHLKVPVNCTCGTVTDKKYGLFLTYPAQAEDKGEALANTYGVSLSDLELYNPGTNWSSIEANKILFIPAKGTSEKNRTVVIAGAVIGGAGFVLLCALLVVVCLCCSPYYGGGNKARLALELNHSFDGSDARIISGPGSKNASNPSIRSSGTLSRELPPDFNDYKSVEFSYEELAAATNNFNVANKIGEGGYGAVYLATLRGQKLAVKRMNLQATREFLAELKVLTHVHHTNLVQLIGYCTVDSLFLIYEFVENGTLAEHLRRSIKGIRALTWAQRVQIALDAARGLEYIHEHTKPTYIHRDVKSTNILIDKHYHAKVADFGLTKLTESSGGGGSFSLTLPTRLVGTFGYMSPEYARFGDVSPMVDVYSFGVVLFEILSAKEAIVREDGPSSKSSGSKEQQGLVTLFESVLKSAEGKARLKEVMDPALDNYPVESAWKMAQLAGMCTKENPELRPTMRVVVVALMTLATSTQSWEVGSAFSNDYFRSGSSTDSR